MWVAAGEKIFFVHFVDFLFTSVPSVASSNSISVPIAKTLFFTQFWPFLSGILFTFDTTGVRFRTLADSFQINSNFSCSLLKIIL
jgi:hypothetical protein